MRRFKFRLQSLLRLRSQIERASRRDLAAAMGDVNTIDQRLAAAAQGLRDCGDQAADMGAVGLLARSLEQGLRRYQWRLRNDLQTAQKKLDATRAEYVQKARDLRTLTKLREQRRAEWRLAMQKHEQAELDELSSLARTAAAAAGPVGGNEA